MADKTIYILRHGQTDYNLQGIVQGGGVDTSLNATGRSQALAFYNKYQHLPFAKVLTSSLKRTHETIDPFLLKGLQWEQHPEINEMGWGDHEGKAATEQSKKEYDSVTGAWQRGDYHAAMPNGESALELQQRLEVFVAHLQQRTEELLLVCSHGRAMRGLMCVLKEEPLANMNNYSHSNTGLWVAKQQGRRFELTLENDTSHLLVKEGEQWRSKR
ncbi:MAG: histidine phosphatase family protein [Lewinella sp.]|jgi:probable phosphoglycerate mutase|uniref:histidine phosphatase family protein n=1 Tax=Lewinella sp. TaxID=2004506 RepID=UPI003D6C387E